MTPGPELATVERPFLDQLALMGWQTVKGNLDLPSVTGRTTFREVLRASELREAVERINLREGKPWLDDGRISEAVSALERIAAPHLIEANQAATDLMLTGTSVEGLPDWEHGRSRTIHYIDWEHLENNTFTAINQFRVDCPGGQAKGFIVPDIVLLVNGIPVVVIECKSPGTSEPIPSAIDQLRRYSNQRKASGEVEEDEGNERLFHTNQFLVATSFDEARASTISGDAEHYLEWKDTAPVPLGDVRQELGVENLSSQHRLVAGMLRPAHLLDIMRHFIAYPEDSGRVIKIVSRYQQFRAVRAAIDRLLEGKTRLEDGEFDRRGGIIWHTQGSGKSLSMVFLVRKMRSIPELRRFKIVMVTDRKDLERQLSATATLTGETVRVGRSVEDVKQLLSEPGPALVFATIQKYQERDLEGETGGQQAGRSASDSDLFPVLNEDEAILVMVDEAHRSHTDSLHGNLMRALPNAARIGFTGTPIIMGAKKRTHDIFGEFIDTYTIRQSEEDGATVPILYEGRTAEGAIKDGGDLDELFEDMFAERSEEELDAIKRKYGTRGAVLDSTLMIEAKARDMLRHYVEHLLPNGLKAQVVSNSRLAAVRYQAALEQARDELVREAEGLESGLRDLDDEALAGRARSTAAAVRAWRSLDLLKRLEFAAVISAGNNDDPAWSEWSDGGKVEARIARFKKPLAADDPTRTDPLAFLCVKSMLLTGFDAPVEGVMYLDRPIKEAELLQAIARVNRPSGHKAAGIVVDYYGVAQHLAEALAAYTAEDIDGAFRSLADEIPTLRDRHQRVLEVFRSRGIDQIGDADACVELLEDERVRAEFAVRLKQFLNSLDLVLPRPEGLPFVRDAKALGFIYTRARNRYREGLPPLAKSIGGKVRKLIDDHIISLGVDPKIPPISITDADFGEHVQREASPRAKASEMEHAIRHHVTTHIEQDPVFFQRLSERLEEILQQFGENWEQLSLALGEFIDEVVGGRQEGESGALDPGTQAPFFDVLREEHEQDRVLSASDVPWLEDLTVQLVDFISQEIRIADFWRNAHAQEVLRGRVFQFLDDYEIVDFDRADQAADRLVELAKANHDRLVT